MCVCVCKVSECVVCVVNISLRRVAPKGREKYIFKIVESLENKRERERSCHVFTSVTDKSRTTTRTSFGCSKEEEVVQFNNNNNNSGVLLCI